MPFSITWDSNFVIFNYYGAVTADDMVKSNQLVYGDHRFDNLRWQLACFEQAESVEIDERSIRLIAYMDAAAAHSNPSITVAFTGSPDVLSQIEAHYQSANCPPAWPVLRFDSQEQALAHIAQKESPPLH